MYDDVFREVLLDMLTVLEMGHDIQSTSVYHDEFKSFLMSYNIVSEERLIDNVKEFEDEGTENKSEV